MGLPLGRVLWCAALAGAGCPRRCDPKSCLGCWTSCQSSATSRRKPGKACAARLSCAARAACTQSCEAVPRTGCWGAAPTAASGNFVALLPPHSGTLTVTEHLRLALNVTTCAHEHAFPRGVRPTIRASFSSEACLRSGLCPGQIYRPRGEPVPARDFGGGVGAADLGRPRYQAVRLRRGGADRAFSGLCRRRRRPPGHAGVEAARPPTPRRGPACRPHEPAPGGLARRVHPPRLDFDGRRCRAAGER